jgi:predicted peptidase
MKKSILVVFMLISFISINAQTKEDFVKTSFMINGDTLPVRILYPENFDATKKYPVMLFLHGRGESGKDNQRQLTHGSKMFLDPEFRKKFDHDCKFPL